MRIIKFLSILLLVLALIAFGGGMLLSPKFTVLRSTEIRAEPAAVYALVADPREWQKWSAWNRRDPAMRMSFSGAASGAGAGWAWHSESQGNGSMAFTAADPGKQLDFDLNVEDFDTVSTGVFIFEPTPNGTRVTWMMNGDMGSNPLLRWFALGADKLVGGDFDTGLANLKAVAERS